MMMESDTLSPESTQACHDFGVNDEARNINNSINSISSATRRTRLQTAAYLLGARQQLPDIEALEGRQVEGLSKQPLDLDKVEFRIPLNTTDRNISMTYMDCFFSESDHPTDILDSTKAVMNVPKSYEHLGWRLSTARHTDPPHRLLTSQDLDSAFKAARTEPMSARKRKKLAIEIVNTHDARDLDNSCVTLPNTPHFDEFRKTHKERSASSLHRVPTELISPIIHNHVHLSSAIDDMCASNSTLFGRQGGDPPKVAQPLERTYALYLESDEETDEDEPPQDDIGDILTSIDLCYPALRFLQYVTTWIVLLRQSNIGVRDRGSRRDSG
ncbi:hypothetical protein EDD22DRAFT_964735 [Suillus occidentalis]|nr:hypothetical protein EDD22DRAFT_964735 [Suillus occidentalis]